MAYHHHHHHHDGGISAEFSGDERESRSGGEERPENDLNDKPIYLLEHLATFTVNKDSGIVFPADGMRRLLQLEKTTGIWSQKMQLCLDYQWVLIMDYETGNIIERFPATLIQEPTAFTSTDAMELYNNILVFIVSGGSNSRSEMHIFQSQSVSAVHLVEDLKNLRSGKIITQQRETMQHHHYQQQRQQQKHHDSQGLVQQQYQNNHYHGYRSSGRGNVGQVVLSHALIGETDSEHERGGGGGGGISGGGLNDETSSTSSDKYERDVIVLNHCFDDIEKFIARLQHAAAASRELERRRRNRKTKKKDPGEGLLTLRTRPPHEKEFIDIFAKFKLSLNLLAKLKAHIHDPNAPELVHFLFTPLALIVEASSDTYYETQLPARVVNPLLTRDAINLLINCVTSKETELWRSLGDAWVIPRDQWKDDVGSYHPVFLDGWSPDYLVIDELELLQPTTPTNITKRRMEAQKHQQHHQIIGFNNGRAPPNDDYDGMAIALNEKYTISHGNDRHDATGVDLSTRSEISVDSIECSGNQTTSTFNNGGVGGVAATLQSITAGIQNFHTFDGSRMNDSGNQTDMNATNANTTNDEQILETWLNNLQAAGAKIVLVTYPRTANNDKELSVVRGEYLEIMDDTRKWWKARNIRNQIAHVPHTIVTPFNYGDTESGNNFYGQQQKNNNQKSRQAAAMQHNAPGGNNASEVQRSTDTSDWVRKKHLGKKGEFRYF